LLIYTLSLHDALPIYTIMCHLTQGAPEFNSVLLELPFALPKGHITIAFGDFMFIQNSKPRSITFKRLLAPIICAAGISATPALSDRKSTRLNSSHVKI